MTSIMNLPATYAIFNDMTFIDGVAQWDLFIDGEYECFYDTKQEAEQAAREHFMNVNE